MKKLSVKDQSACMACLACELACSEVFYKETNTSKACLHIIEKKGAVKTQVCVQCGKCAEACEAGAIKQNAKGVYMVNKKLCTGCGKCAEACPFGLMVKAEGEATASKCIACGACVAGCPSGALQIVPWDDVTAAAQEIV